jgi:4-diphosphocytidyl-2-C-methyl-D-erythritol kinase
VTASAVQWYPAPAKINLYLAVTGRRADGYHLLQTVFRFLDHGDRLAFDVRDDGRIERVNPLAGVPPETDLVVRAARLLQAEAGCPLGADITLDKRLPMGGGLGGGSSDAATTLLVLNRLWGTGLSRDDLQRLAVRLGADVPVFVFGRAAFAEGIGDVLRPMALEPAWYVVLVPPVAIATAWVFGRPELTRNTPAVKMSGFSGAWHDPARGTDAGNRGGGRDGFRGAFWGSNDLAPVVINAFPEVARHLAYLVTAAGGRAAMSGSGACVFGAFADAAKARRAFAARPADMTGFVARGIDLHPLFQMVS